MFSLFSEALFSRAGAREMVAREAYFPGASVGSSIFVTRTDHAIAWSERHRLLRAKERRDDD
jgi:hypothetical protein